MKEMLKLKPFMEIGKLRARQSDKRIINSSISIYERIWGRAYKKIWQRRQRKGKIWANSPVLWAGRDKWAGMKEVHKRQQQTGNGNISQLAKGKRRESEAEAEGRRGC